jgi:LysM repeat protein
LQDCAENITTENPCDDNPVVVPVPVVRETPCTTTTVIVQANESPGSIAKKFGVDVNELLRINQKHKFTNCGKNKTTFGFLVGQKITLPTAVECDKLKDRLTDEQSRQLYLNQQKAKYDSKPGDYCNEDGKIDQNLYESWKK